MKIQFRLCLIFFCLQHGFSNGQTLSNHILDFQPTYGKSSLVLNDKNYFLDKGDSVLFNTLKFYISGIELLNDGLTVWKEENSFHLMDASNENSFSVLLKRPLNITFNKIKFNLGIDSITNSSGAMGGDLDPTKGMYWTWQNGYINFKLEGKSNQCKTRNNEFEFHIGGYQYPNNALQTIILLTPPTEKTKIYLDIESLLKKIDLTNVNHIMSPCNEAVLISKNVADNFSVIAP